MCLCIYRIYKYVCVFMSENALVGALVVAAVAAVMVGQQHKQQ